MLSRSVASRRSSTPGGAGKNQQQSSFPFPSNHYSGSSTCRYNTRLNARVCAPGKRTACTVAMVT
ncbi:hypothetical protein BT93_F3297 [Corymbia citriodora subsp. variegata]|nr:hypothetical protein BT93_F3297 [Corymbia citriodora subsp. variegata]